MANGVTRFNAIDMDESHVGSIEIDLTDYDEAPYAVLDQHGATWVRMSPGSGSYMRVRCGQATLRVDT